MFATYVIFCASIHLTFSLPPSKPVNYQLQPLAVNSNFYRNQYAYVNRENFERLKDNAQMQALKQNSYPPQNYNVNRQGFEQQDTSLQDQKSLLQNLFYSAKPIANQHYQTLAPVQNVQLTNEIINRNIHTSVPKTNLPTISEQRPNILRTNNENIFPSPSIRVPYNAVTRKKAYTIIHPNGAIEESDNFQDIIKLYPKYSLINSNDVQNTLPPKNPVIQSPERVYARSPVANPTLVPLFRKPTLRTVPEELPRETMFTNTFKDIKTERNPPLVTKEIFTKPVEKDAIQDPKNGSKTVKNEIKTDYPKPIVDVKVTNIVNKTKESQNDLPRSEQHKTLTVVDKNLSKINQIDRKTLIEDKVVHDSLLQAHLTDQNTVTEKNTNVHKDENADISLPLDIDIIKDVTNLITSTLSEINNVEDVFKVDQADHKLHEDKIANLTDENTNIEINVNVYNDAKENISLPLDVAIIKDVIDLIADNTTQCINDDEQDDEKIYIPNISLLKDNDTDTPFWFNAADQSVWDMLLGKNNSSAIFFFVPSAVLEKNTSVTIYPNGTRVEETVVIRKEGDKPVVSKTTIITHAPDGEINET